MGMRVLTWNIRGIRRSEKKKAVRGVIRRNQPKIVFIQEKKLENMGGDDIKKLWNSDGIEFAFSPTVCSARGLLCMWDSEYFQVSD
ncbi:hypothetical protein HRI_004364200 [Hibiscus trionum]|uniref:Endonuclease/exonuclease/phosphatase domain-containing protein n=1 Tax=Hibiscus trionum TaxID=183268 RepID=A0A9W7J2J9_HIBTR|nr:hypothetical protein HRI_004364200 [Hibiscus trionum]